MKPSLPTFALLLALAAGPAFAQAPTAVTETLKKVAARYSLTEQRIAETVGRRLNPQPLPASLPNPFYSGVELTELAAPPPETELVPDAPDLSDADTLAKIGPALRISGLVVRDGLPHLIVNSIVCKAGDVIPIPTPGRDTPIFIQVRKISPDAFTLGLNAAELTLPLKL
ncbi:hypothetical protein Verru16b_01528 [Lacunisphaera limnophila]|uniref:Uncharacterized protein n=1 Tax=Lacunisphaera limnophila TaxID=1838286 RepID=A0A1D8AUD6_9BACT|nr:hypothetical protein [Lacunisphaera limnophila]AOS44466.1 hypothetical protein Verru16b_01528 [Lacunisphaera limnophila]